MPVELTQIISVLSFLVAAFALGRNLRGDAKTDAGQMMEVIVKLETINENVKEIKTDMKDVKVDVEKLKERVIKIEQSTKSAHHRIDTMQGKNYDETDE